MPWWVWLLIAWALLFVAYAGFVGWLIVRGRRGVARGLVTLIPDCLVLVTRLARDRRVPRRRKFLLLGVAVYLTWPLDPIPDFIPVAGQLDDAIVVLLVLRHFIRAGGEGLIRELWSGPEESLQLILAVARPKEQADGTGFATRDGSFDRT